MLHKPLSTLVSAIQPTGTLHLGNYLGAIQQWTVLQQQYSKVFYAIADLHALTTTPKLNNQTIQSMLAWILASGVCPKRANLFVQSSVPAHTQLCWILTCLAPMGDLSRMTQWKSKSTKSTFTPLLKLGLFSYPVLMAADILLYQGTHVPVGADQLQHLELARDLARSFNSTYETDLFPTPKAITNEFGNRIMSLTNPIQKMSKSDIAQASRIDLLDSPKEIGQKIRKAVTDSNSDLTMDLDQRPGLANLVTIYMGCLGLTHLPTHELSGIGGHGAFKNLVVSAVVSKLVPIQSEYLRLMQDPMYLNQVLENGNEQARSAAQLTLSRVWSEIGLR